MKKRRRTFIPSRTDELLEHDDRIRKHVPVKGQHGEVKLLNGSSKSGKHLGRAAVSAPLPVVYESGSFSFKFVDHIVWMLKLRPINVKKLPHQSEDAISPSLTP